MPLPELGVIVGKFYPPHRGHTHLIDVASRHVRQLVVIVCSRKEETIAAELRAAWLREIHPGVEVMRVEDVYDPDDSALWAANTIRWLGRAPDVAFTSEDYGPRWAALMGATHVMVDRDRRTVACRGRDVRAHPLEHFHLLEPSVRAFLVPRVAVLGAESTGTTTLAAALAAHYGTTRVAEYGREYCETLGDFFTHAWCTGEFIDIAREQNRREDLAARDARPPLVCDTNSFATAVWHERYVGRRSSDVEALSAGRRYAHHFLTDIGIPFVQDGLRDGEAIRASMHRLFIERLTDAAVPFTVVSGALDERVAAAVQTIDELMASTRI